MRVRTSRAARWYVEDVKDPLGNKGQSWYLQYAELSPLIRNALSANDFPPFLHASYARANVGLVDLCVPGREIYT